MKKSLEKIQEINNFSTDKGSTHSYLKIYDELFSNIINPSILEIGVASGGSIKLWQEYTNNIVHGVDIQLQLHAPNLFESNILDWNIPQKYDIIIDDGSHTTSDMINTYHKLKDFYNYLYIIEDIQDFSQLDEIKKLNPDKIIDLRHVKERYDDILIIFEKK